MAQVKYYSYYYNKWITNPKHRPVMFVYHHRCYVMPNLILYM